MHFPKTLAAMCHMGRPPAESLLPIRQKQQQQQQTPLNVCSTQTPAG